MSLFHGASLKGVRFISRSRALFWGIAVLLAVSHAALLAWQAYGDSPTWDEFGHFAAGIEYWKHWEFDLYCVNPPGVRLLATIPFALRADVHDPDVYIEDHRAIARREFGVGAQLARDWGIGYFSSIAHARLMCVVFSVLGAYICYRWAQDLHGTASGALAAILWMFSPTILGYGHLITPDVGAAACGLTAMYAFRKWLLSPSFARTIGTGILLGIAELTKTTWILLFPLLLALWVSLGRSIVVSQKRDTSIMACPAIKLLLVLSLGVLLINIGYGFEGSFRRLGDYQFVSATLRGGEDEGIYNGVTGSLVGNRFADTGWAHLRVPLPADYVSGIDIQRRDFESGMWSYLGGRWRHGGWWYYYLYALLLKEPIGTWVIFLLAVLAIVYAPLKYGGCPVSDELLVLAPLAAIIILVSSQTGVNHHVRYALPALPYVFIFSSRVGRSISNRHHLLTAAWSIALAWSVFSSLSAAPHSLSYFNELAGGPRGGHRYLANSNADWGQDLNYLKLWYVHHPDARPLYLGYDVPLIDPASVGIRSERLPPMTPEPDPVRGVAGYGPKPGWFAVSVNKLHDREHRYDYFNDLTPVDWVGYTMPVYHISLGQANTLRQKYGLPPLDASAVAEPPGPKG